MNQEYFSEKFKLGRDYLIKPYQLPVPEPDHPSEVPPEPRRVKCYQCAYCQYDTLHIDELMNHFEKDKAHPFKFGATGVHPELLDVHPELHKRHLARLDNINAQASMGVEDYVDEAPAASAFGKTPESIMVGAKVPAPAPVPSAAPAAVKEVK